MIKTADFIAVKNKGAMAKCNRCGLYFQMDEMVADLEKPGFVHKKLGTFLQPEMDSGIKTGSGWFRI